MTYIRQIAPVTEDNQELAPTWESHVLIPLAQNILGGVAVGALGMIGVIAATGTWNWAIDLYNAAVWSALAGGVVTCVFTVVRFFGDDWGLIARAYAAGQQSRGAQIAALELELRTAYAAQSAVEADGGATSAIKRTQELRERARRDASKIIEVAFQGDSIRRDAMKSRGMGQNDWERAMRLLKSAGALNEEGALLARTPAQAMKAIDERLTADLTMGDKFTPAWK